MCAKRRRNGAPGKRCSRSRASSGVCWASAASRSAKASSRFHFGRYRLRQATANRLVGAHDVIGLDARRFARHGRGDARIAVAIAADPRAPSGQCRPSAANGALELRRDDEQRFVEERHRRADLVERPGPVGADRRRLPQDRHLLAQPAAQVVVLGRRQARIVEPVEQRVDAAQCDEQGPPASLGGMGREHGRDGQPTDQRVDLGASHALRTPSRAGRRRPISSATPRGSAR